MSCGQDMTPPPMPGPLGRWDHAKWLQERLGQARAENCRLVDALAEIELKARWYADNDQRDPQEVDHALCVEILDLAERALNA